MPEQATQNTKALSSAHERSATLIRNGGPHRENKAKNPNPEAIAPLGWVLGFFAGGRTGIRTPDLLRVKQAL